MPINPISGPGYDLLKVALDATSLRHQVIASNIANSSTENYQPLRVSFEAQLQQEISSSGALGKDIATHITPRVENDPDSAGVTVDQEMVHLTQNFIHHQALLKALNNQLELTSLAINEGKR